MRKKLISAALSGVIFASAMPYIPATDTYLIRDKWGYCTTANYVESEHFIIFYGNSDTTGKGHA